MRCVILTTTVRLAMLLAVSAAVLSGQNRFITVASAEDSAVVSEADMMFFYKNPSPERLAQLLTYFDGLSGKPNTEPPIIGFLAGAFQKYPNDIDRMIPGKLSPKMRAIVAIALRLAGQDDKAHATVDQLRVSGAAVPDLARVASSLDAVPVTGPNEFDMLWGASFATGDPKYCLKIMEHFASVANINGHADDMVNIARSVGTGTDLHWVVEKFGPDKGRELLVQSTALWVLDSNARQHEFVRTALGKYLSAHPGEPASKALRAVAQSYGHYDLGKVMSLGETSPGKSSATVNVAYLTLVLDDLERHAGTYPPHFVFADDRPRAEHDVVTISGLIDPLLGNLAHNAPLLLRLALLHAVAHNLDIPGSAQKALSAFSALLQIAPNDPQANYQYGAFLAATTNKGAGIPFLEKALDLGVVNARYWLGLSYIVIGEKEKAIESLDAYTRLVPGDQKAAQLLDAIRNDKFKIQERQPSP